MVGEERFRSDYWWAIRFRVIIFIRALRGWRGGSGYYYRVELLFLFLRDKWMDDK